MSENAGSNAKQETLERTQAVKRAHEKALMARANVVGVGVGLVQRGGAPTGQVGIIVMVSRKRPAGELALLLTLGSVVAIPVMRRVRAARTAWDLLPAAFVGLLFAALLLGLMSAMRYAVIGLAPLP